MSASNLSYCPCANATTITLAAHAHQNNSTVTAISDSDCPNNSLAVKEQGEWLKIENCLLLNFCTLVGGGDKSHGPLKVFM